MNWIGRSRPRRMGWSFILGESAKAGTVNRSRIARVFIGGGIIRYARGMERFERHAHTSTRGHGTLVLGLLVLCARAMAQPAGAMAAAEKDGIPPTILDK